MSYADEACEDGPKELRDRDAQNELEWALRR